MSNKILKPTLYVSVKSVFYESSNVTYYQNYKRTLRPHLNCLEQDDPRLIREIQEYSLEPPSDLPYNISQQYDESLEDNIGIAEYEQDEILDVLLFQGKVRSGFFFEAGAYNFVSASNTLWYERKYNWSGLLVEPHVLTYQEG